MAGQGEKKGSLWISGAGRNDKILKIFGKSGDENSTKVLAKKGMPMDLLYWASMGGCALKFTDLSKLEEGETLEESNISPTEHQKKVEEVAATSENLVGAQDVPHQEQ